MRRGNLFFPAASTFMLFLLISCGTAPPTGPPAQWAGEGSSEHNIDIFATLPTPAQASPVPAPPPQPPPQTVGERVTERWLEMVEIPHTVEGRQLSADWLVAFDREFAAYNDDPDVIGIRVRWLENRELIFLVTKPDFMEKLAKLPTGAGSEEAHARLLAETFPLRADKTMAIYRDYRAEMLSHQKPVLRRTFDKAMDSISSVRDWLSDAARKAIHGSGRGTPQK